MSKTTWHNPTTITPAQKYTCGYCGHLVASDRGYRGQADQYSFVHDGSAVYICPHCAEPTYIRYQRGQITKQIPGIRPGNAVRGLPDEVGRLYDEARTCTGVSSYTAAVMICRKILMHIAVEKGADKNQSFKEYVNYLDKKNYLPPNSKGWVDYIRTQGNEANHEIVPKEKHDAMQLIEFVEMLARFIYEFPVRVSRYSPQNDSEDPSEKK